MYLRIIHIHVRERCLGHVIITISQVYYYDCGNSDDDC